MIKLKVADKLADMKVGMVVDMKCMVACLAWKVDMECMMAGWHGWHGWLGGLGG